MTNPNTTLELKIIIPEHSYLIGINTSGAYKNLNFLNLLSCHLCLPFNIYENERSPSFNNETKLKIQKNPLFKDNKSYPNPYPVFSCIDQLYPDITYFLITNYNTLGVKITEFNQYPFLLFFKNSEQNAVPIIKKTILEINEHPAIKATTTIDINTIKEKKFFIL